MIDFSVMDFPAGAFDASRLIPRLLSPPSSEESQETAEPGLPLWAQVLRELGGYQGEIILVSTLLEVLSVSRIFLVSAQVLRELMGNNDEGI